MAEPAILSGPGSSSTVTVPPWTASAGEAAAASSSVAAPRQKHVKRLVVDDGLFEEGRAWVRAQRRSMSRATSTLEVLDVVSLHLHLRHQAWLASKTPGRPAAHAWAREVGDILGRSTDMSGRAWKAFAEQRRLYLHKASTGPRGYKPRRIPRTKRLRVAIRKFLIDKEARGERVVADTLTGFLCDNGFLPAHLSDASGKDRLAVQRCVQRLVTDLGLRRHGTIKYKEKARNAVLLDDYIHVISNGRSTRRIVYVGEASTVFPQQQPGGEPSPDAAPQHEGTSLHNDGAHYGFIGALVGEDPNVIADEREDKHHAQLLKGTVQVYNRESSARAKRDDQQGSERFLAWLDLLLAELARLEIRDAIIVVDDARHHKSLPHSTPKAGHSKPDLLALCHELGIEVQGHWRTETLRAKVKAWVEAHVQPVSVSKVADAGHQLVFLPVGYSDLQPMDALWTLIKGACTSASPATVATDLMQAFHAVTEETVHACLQRTWQEVASLQATLRQLDEGGRQASDEDESTDGYSSEDHHDAAPAMAAEGSPDPEALVVDEEDEGEEEVEVEEV